MKKLLSLALVVAFSCVSVAAIACPKGETLTGGTGPHHKGGKCVPKTATTDTKAATTDTKVAADKAKADKAAAKKAKADEKKAAADKKATDKK